ncbi:MAG: anaerobic ribonucleoside-triphosphate reductase activating protein [Rhodospirillales bacterium]|nr:anaerobic ribonucleoside-triphosphate reductase activating protein [Rhodospirillales bacterium]
MHATPPLRISGLTPLTTIDFPGRIAAVVWLRGCALRCVYCHNADLQNPSSTARDPSWESLVRFFERRRGFLDGVVFSGGEPLLQSALPDAVTALRDLGFETALHTAGPCPGRLIRILPHLDWVGFDVKAPFEEYESITQIPKSGENARESLVVLQRSDTPFEVRTTIDPNLMDMAMVMRMAAQLQKMGLSRWVLQEATGKRLPVGLEDRIAPLFDHLEIRKASEARPDTPPPRPESGRYPPRGARAA